MADFYAIITDIGEAKITNALALGDTVDITELALGDGEGDGAQGTPLPDPEQTALVSEQRRASLNQLSVDPENASVVIAEQVIPADVGGWWIREMGLFDVDGDMIAVSNAPPTYKPVLTSGSGRTQVVRMQVIVSDTGGVTLTIDPSIVLSTHKYVDDAIESHAQSRNHPAATTSDRGMVELATQAEVDAGTDTSRPVVPERLARSHRVLGRSHDGDPNGNVAADAVRERCWDISQAPPRLYISTAADGTVGGTAWTKITNGLSALSDKTILSTGAAGTIDSEIPLPLISSRRWQVMNSPILGPSDSDWDDAGLIDPTIIWDEEKNRVAVTYSGQSSGDNPSRMGIAFGSDLYNLKKFSGNPIIDVGDAGSWDETHAWDGQVFSWGGGRGHSEKHAILYVGRDSEENYGWGLVYSDDLETWSKDGSNPIITDADGLGDEPQDPFAILVAGTWHIFYEYTDSSSGDKVIGHVTTEDWQSFTVDPNNPVATSSTGDMEDPQVMWHNGEWHLFAERHIGGKRSIAHAVNSSPDGWGEDPGEAFIKPYGRAGLDVAHLGYYWHRGQWYMACCGRRSGGDGWHLFAVEERPKSPTGSVAVLDLESAQGGVTPSTWTTIEFDTVTYDYTSEWDSATHKFIADGPKTVEVLVSATQQSVNVAAGTMFTIRLMKNSDRVGSGRAPVATGSNEMLQTHISRIVELSEGDELQIDAFVEGTAGGANGSIKGGDGYTSLSIRELG